MLVDDCSRLQRDYPGPNSSNLAAKQTQVLQEWEELQERAAHRKQQLLDSARMHNFLSQVSRSNVSTIITVVTLFCHYNNSSDAVS